jgi:hypothetical protein
MTQRPRALSAPLRLACALCTATYYVAPVLAIGSFIWIMFVSDWPALLRILLSSAGLFGFAFAGMFARNVATTLTERHD